jgi:hypothetical protein
MATKKPLKIKPIRLPKTIAELEEAVKEVLGIDLP